MGQAGRWIAYNELQTVVPLGLVKKLLAINRIKLRKVLPESISTDSAEFDDAVILQTITELAERGYEFLMTFATDRGYDRCVPFPPLHLRRSHTYSEEEGRSQGKR